MFEIHSEFWPKLVFSVVSGAAGGTVGALVATNTQRWWETRLLFARSEAKDVEGTWTGTFTQGQESEATTTEITLNLSSQWWRRVTGTIDYGTSTIHCSGGFFQHRILMLHYWTSERAVLQHGTITARFSSDAKCLDGLFVGYGPETEKLVNGSITVTRP